MDISTQEWNQAFPNAGLDQIVVTSSDFELKDWSGLTTELTVGGSGEILSQSLAELESGEELLGKRAWHNSDWWGLTLSHKDQARVRISYNPSRHGRGSNLFPASGRQVAAASEQLLSEMASLGVVVDPGRLRLSALEVASPLIVTRPVEHYLDALEEWAQPKYLNDTRRERGWLCFSNGSRSIQFYDKALQLGESLPGHHLRIESKAKRSRVIEKMGLRFGHLLEGQIGSAVTWHYDMVHSCIGGLGQ